MTFLIDQLTGFTASRDRAGVEPGRALRRFARGRSVGIWLRRGLAGLTAGAALWIALAVAGAALGSGAAGRGQDDAATPPQAWSEVIRPLPLYDVGGTDFAKLPRTYEARRHRPDGAREDVLSFGSPGDGQPYLRIVLARHGEGTSDPESLPLADALARAAGGAAATAAQTRPLPSIETRFGALERASFTLWRAGAPMACEGFRAEPDGGEVLTLWGFACPGAARPLADTAVACAVDRLDLVAAGGDERLRTLFVAAERRPGAAACREGVLSATADQPASSGPFAALRRHAAWLEAGSGGPPLRGPLDATDGEP